MAKTADYSAYLSGGVPRAELFYHNGDAVMAVKKETDPVFKLGKPEVPLPGEICY